MASFSLNDRAVQCERVGFAVVSEPVPTGCAAGFQLAVDDNLFSDQKLVDAIAEYFYSSAGSFLADGSFLAEYFCIAAGSCLAESFYIAAGSCLAESFYIAAGSYLAEGSYLAGDCYSAVGGSLQHLA